MKLNKQSTRKKIYVVSIILAVLFLGGAGVWTFQHMQLTKADRGEEAPREQAPSGDTPSQINDTSGEDVETSENPAQSESKEIIVHSPQENAILKPGSTISGEASVDSVRYRIIDYERGVIARGELTVSGDNQFSAVIDSFTHYGSSGEVNIYSTSSTAQQETNNITIPVRFAQ